MSTRSDRYSSVAIALHWLIALSILFQIMLGWRMDDDSKSASVYLVYQLHKSVGITILLLSLARLVWRLTHPAPPLPAHLRPWERGLAHLTHIGFYAIMIGLPVTGWIMVSASRTNIPTLLFGVVPWPHLPGIPELAAAPKHIWHQIGELGHGLLAKLTYLLLILHVGGALKHQIIDRDSTLSRMLPGVRTGRVFDPIAILAAIVVLIPIAGGQLVFRSAPHPATPVSPSPVSPSPVSPNPVSPNPETASAPPATPVAAAQIPQAVPVSATPAPLAKWSVDKGSSLGFTTSWSGQPVTGQFSKWTAVISFSPDDLAHSSVTVHVDPASASTGDPQRDQTLPTEDWLNTARFPEAVFSATGWQKSAMGYRANGTLSLKGVTRPVQLTFALKLNGDKARATGTARLDRTAFGVGQGEMGGTDQIPAAVTVDFALSARRLP